MVSSHELLAAIEAAVLSSPQPSPAQRIRLLHAIRASLPSLHSLLSYPGPKESDRAQLKSRQVKLPNQQHPIPLDDTDVEIALKLSDDLNLNEISCVRLLVSANTEWALSGRDKVERYRLAAGLWYMERRDLITSLFILLRSVVLDQGLDPDVLSEIQKHLEDLVNGGLRSRLLALIKELNREEAAGYGRHNSEQYVKDIRGTLVERRAIVHRERLSLSQCLALSVLVSTTNPKDIKDTFLTLKDSTSEVNESTGVVELQIISALMFTVIIALVSDALRTSHLSSDASFRQEFQELVMTVSTNSNVEGYVGVIRLAWAVHLILTHDRIASRGISSNVSLREMSSISACLDTVCSQNVFQFLLEKVIASAAYKNDDEDMTYMYSGYLHKMMMCFVSNPISREKVKELKDKAMSTLSRYMLEDFGGDGMVNSDEVSLSVATNEPFVSLLELVSEIYEKEAELLHGNDEVWQFVIHAGEDHTNIQTLVSFLRLLSTLALDEEGAARVHGLLQGRAAFRSIGWNKLFDCLTIYEDRFKKAAIQSSSTALLPDFPKPEAHALVAYLNILKKVVENGNPIERKKWFPDIEPLFKLLSYENVPPYLKGALRDSIAAFIKVSPLLKDTIWKFLEQYELPVIVDPSLTATATATAGQHISTKLYDMRYELNEVEARRERYPSTISYLNLVNALIREETDLSDSGHRFLGIYKFVYEHVFGPFPQRAYADPCEKWELVLACLQHFHMVLSMFWTKDLENKGPSSVEAQLPSLELMKELMSGKQAFRNVMNILLMGVDTLIEERSTKVYGHLQEKAVHLSFQIILLAFEHDINLADAWCPFYQPLDVILAQDHKQILALLQYVRYELLPAIQQSSVKFMSIFSSRTNRLVHILFKSGAAKSLMEDYATCLEYRFDEAQPLEEQKDDIGLLILQMLIENVSHPVPNVTHLLLSYDVENRVERTKLQPKFYYSCLRVILDNLEKLSRPDMNALLHELSFQLLYELSVNPSTAGPIMDLLSTRRYQFFCKHIETVCVAPLPKGSGSHNLRVSTLHQRAWLLKLLALELHVSDTTEPSHREACVAIISHTFNEPSAGHNFQTDINATWNNTAVHKNKLLELLNIVRFRCSDADTKYPQILSNTKYETKVQEILAFPKTSELGGVYCYSERGDRLIDIDALEEKLFEMSSEMGLNAKEAEKEEFRVLSHNLMRWGLRYNNGVEEGTAQLHMLSGWSQIVEVGICRRMSVVEDHSHSEILLELLDSSVSTTASPDCSKRMAIILTNVALTCMAKLRDERFSCPRAGGSSAESDGVTCLDILSGNQFHSIPVKLIMALQRNESSEPLRRRQYALLLSYMQYCGSILNPDVPSSVLRYLLSQEQPPQPQPQDDDDDDDDYLYLHKIGKEQNDLARANFSVLRKEAQGIVDLVTKDATQGSEAGKAIAYYVLDAFVNIDHDMFFLNQIQSRGLLRSILFYISSPSLKEAEAASISLEWSQRLCTMEAQLSLLLRICHKYSKHGAQILQSMSALDHLSSCALLTFPNMVGFSQVGQGHGGKDRIRISWSHRQKFVTPILRLVSCITSLVHSSQYLEVKNKIVREVLDFIRSHHAIFAQILREDVKATDESSLERLNLAVFILCKVWPYEENDEHGFAKELFSKMLYLFKLDQSSSDYMQLSDLPEDKKCEVMMGQLSLSLISYLYLLVRKKEMRLLVTDPSHSKPTLETLLSLLISVNTALERAGEELFVLLNKIQDINELSRQEVDEIIKLYSPQNCLSPSDNIRKRRYVAMVEMCRMAGNRDQLLSILLQIAESIIHILLLHLQDSESADQHDLCSFCEQLHPVLEKLEHLKEEKAGQDLKLFHRSVSTLKEMSIRNMSL